MRFALTLAVALCGLGPGAAAPTPRAAGAISGGRGTISREQATRIRKAARDLKSAANDAEKLAYERNYSMMLFWADQLGELSDDLVDEAGDIIRDGDGQDDEIGHLLHEVHEAYSNFRTVAGNIPEERDRRRFLKGTLKAYSDVFEAICGPTASAEDKDLAPPKPGADDSE